MKKPLLCVLAFLGVVTVVRWLDHAGLFESPAHRQHRQWEERMGIPAQPSPGGP